MRLLLLVCLGLVMGTPAICAGQTPSAADGAPPRARATASF